MSVCTSKAANGKCRKGAGEGAPRVIAEGGRPAGALPARFEGYAPPAHIPAVQVVDRALIDRDEIDTPPEIAADLPRVPRPPHAPGIEREEESVSRSGEDHPPFARNDARHSPARRLFPRERNDLVDVPRPPGEICARRRDRIDRSLVTVEEIEPRIVGDLRLTDVEDDDVAEVTVSRALINRYKQNLQAYCAGLREYCTRRGITYLFTSTEVPFDQIVLSYFRQRGLLK